MHSLPATRAGSECIAESAPVSPGRLHNQRATCLTSFGAVTLTARIQASQRNAK